MRRLSTTDAYLTVLISLTTTLFLSLILALFAGARLGTVKMRAECITEIACESVLAEYNRALFERYDLLMTDTSYGSASADICHTEERLRYYARGNTEPSAGALVTGSFQMTGLSCTGVRIPEYTRATDANCAVLRRQILAYMKAEPVEALLGEAAGNLRILQAKGYDTYDMEAAMDANYAQMQGVLQANGKSTEDVSVPVGEIQAKRRLGLLTIAHPSPGAISSSSVTPAMYYSHRGATEGNGYRGGETLSAADLLLIDRYLTEKCGSHGNEREGSRLKYQLEYLIAGKGNDYSNLESVAGKMLFWREASNHLYILRDSGKVSTAETVASVISFLLMLPELTEPLKHAILFAWSFAESISDLRILFRGGRVPLVKTAESWRMSLGNLLSFGGGDDSGEGLDYMGYLCMLLLLTDLNTKTARFADIAEMDLRETPGNAYFTMDGCLDSFTAELSFTGAVGFSGTFVRRRGYTE